MVIPIRIKHLLKPNRFKPSLTDETVPLKLRTIGKITYNEVVLTPGLSAYPEERLQTGPQAAVFRGKIFIQQFHIFQKYYFGTLGTVYVYSRWSYLFINDLTMS